MLEWLQTTFTAENVALIVTWIGTAITLLATVFKMASSLKVLKNKSDAQITDVTNAVKETLEQIATTTTNAEIKKAIDPILTYLQKSNQTNEVLAKIIALSQDTSAESKIAILDLIASLNVLPSGLIDGAKQDIATMEEQEKQEAEATDKALEDLKTGVDETTTGRV